MTDIYFIPRLDLPDHEDSCSCGWERSAKLLVFCGFCGHFHCPKCGEELPFKKKREAIMEICVQCVECNQDLEEHSVEVKHGNTIYVKVALCSDCVDSAVESRAGE